MAEAVVTPSVGSVEPVTPLDALGLFGRFNRAVGDAGSLRKWSDTTGVPYQHAKDYSASRVRPSRDLVAALGLRAVTRTVYLPAPAGIPPAIPEIPA